jgi:hypothetical protein
MSIYYKKIKYYKLYIWKKKGAKVYSDIMITELKSMNDKRNILERNITPKTMKN